MAGLGEKGLRKRDGQIGPVNPFPPRGSPLMIKLVSLGWFRRERVKRLVYNVF